MSDLTLGYYDENAEDFIAGTVDVDVSTLQKKFLENIPKNGSILDLGCGSGRDTKSFMQMGYDVTAIDGSPELCEMASAYAGCEVRCMDFFQIDDVNRFDGVWACASVLHVEKKRIPELLFILEKALRPGGAIYLSFKYGNFEGERDGRYFTDLDEEGFGKVFDEYVRIYGKKLLIKDEWTTKDVRRDREVNWLNEILTKCVEM